MAQLHSPWRRPEQPIRTLGKDEVHIWRASLQQPPAIIQGLRSILNVEETSKAARYYFEKDRLHYIVARGYLRTLLGRYLNIEPARLHFSLNEYGRPALDPRYHPASLHFNVSHSHELALYGFTYDRELGIDVEYMRTNIEFDELARHSFSPNENKVLRELPAEAKRQGFFNCWTRKEAYIKARGMGLSLPLDLFDVSLRPGEPAALLASRESVQEVGRWSFQALEPGPDYAGALAVEGTGWQLSAWQC